MIEWNYNVGSNCWDTNIDGIVLLVQILPFGLFTVSVDGESVDQGCSTLLQAQGRAKAYAKGKIEAKIRVLQSVWDAL